MILFFLIPRLNCITDSYTRFVFLKTSIPGYCIPTKLQNVSVFLYLYSQNSRATTTGNMSRKVKVRTVVSEICAQTDKQADRRQHVTKWTRNHKISLLPYEPFSTCPLRAQLQVLRCFPFRRGARPAGVWSTATCDTGRVCIYWLPCDRRVRNSCFAESEYPPSVTPMDSLSAGCVSRADVTLPCRRPTRKLVAAEHFRRKQRDS